MGVKRRKDEAVKKNWDTVIFVLKIEINPKDCVNGKPENKKEAACELS